MTPKQAKIRYNNPTNKMELIVENYNILIMGAAGCIETISNRKYLHLSMAHCRLM